MNPTTEELSLPTKTEGMGFETHCNGDISLFKTIAGTWEAKNRNGEGLCSGMNKDAVLFWARNHLYGPLPGVETIVTNIKFNSVPKL